MRPIDADTLKYRREDYGGYDDVGVDERKRGILYLLEKDIAAAPTIDTVKYGNWIKIVDCNTVQCSECFEDFDYIDGLYYLCHGQELPDYCPNCGARMDGKEQKGEIK